MRIGPQPCPPLLASSADAVFFSSGFDKVKRTVTRGPQSRRWLDVERATDEPRKHTPSLRMSCFLFLSLLLLLKIEEVLNRVLLWSSRSPLGSSVERGNWNRKNLEFGAYSGCCSRPSAGMESELGVHSRARSWRAGPPGTLLRFSTFLFRTTKC